VSTPYTPAIDIYVGEGEGEWQAASRYHVWTRKFPLNAAPLSLLERHAGDIARVPEQPRVMHRVPAGTPYHVEHLFGFWHKSSNDTLFLRTEIGDAVDYTMIVATTKIGVETIAWYCPKCGTALGTVDFQARRFGLRAFWKQTTDRAREFNALAERTCAQCGHLHPATYGFNERTDTEEERQGRTQW